MQVKSKVELDHKRIMVFCVEQVQEQKDRKYVARDTPLAFLLFLHVVCDESLLPILPQR